MNCRTCTTRHSRGCEGLPDDHQNSFLAIEPDCEVVGRPTITLQDDTEKVFQGKSLLYLEVPVVAFPKFFTGYIASVTAESKSVISHEFYLWQIRRVYYATPSCRIMASVACVSAQFNGVVESGMAEAATAGKACVDDNQLLGAPQNFKGLLEVIRLYIHSPDGVLPEVEPIIFNSPSDNGSDCLPSSSPTPKLPMQELKDNNQYGKIPQGSKRGRSPSPRKAEHQGREESKDSNHYHNNERRKRCRYSSTSSSVDGSYSRSSSNSHGNCQGGLSDYTNRSTSSSSQDHYQDGLGNRTNRPTSSSSDGLYQYESDHHNKWPSSSSSEDHYQYGLGHHNDWSMYYHRGSYKRDGSSRLLPPSSHNNRNRDRKHSSDHSYSKHSHHQIRHDRGRTEYREKRGHKRHCKESDDDELRKHRKLGRRRDYSRSVSK